MRKERGSSINSVDLRSFLSLLETEGELVRVKQDVNPKFELAAVTAKLDGKQAVIFEKVHGSKIKVACNVVGTPKKFYHAVVGARKVQQAKDIKRAIHARIIEALGSLSEPARGQSGAPFEKNS